MVILQYTPLWGWQAQAVGPDSRQLVLETQLTTKGLDRTQEGRALARVPSKTGCAGRREGVVGLRLNPALFPADDKGDNMAADCFAQV